MRVLLAGFEGDLFNEGEVNFDEAFTEMEGSVPLALVRGE